jgi:hypothetical protein
VAAARPNFLAKLRRIRFSIASTGWRRGLADTATLLLAYQVEAAFARFPWLIRRRYEQSVLGQYNWLLYSN